MSLSISIYLYILLHTILDVSIAIDIYSNRKDVPEGIIVF